MDKPVEVLIQQAEANYHQGQLELAVSFCHQVIQIQPDFAPVYKTLGNILQTQGKLEAAMRAYNQALVLHPEFAAVHGNQGSIFYQNGQFEEAISCYQKAIALQPNLADAHFKLGCLFQSKNNIKSAIVSFQKAIKYQPDCTEAYNNLGILLRENCQEEEAIICLQKAIEIDPYFAGSYWNLATSFQQQGNLQSAAAYLQDCIQLQPGFALAHGNLGYILEQQGKLDEATVSLRHAIALQPDLAMAYGNLGSILHRQGKLEEAISCFQNAIKYDADFPNLYFQGQPHLEKLSSDFFVKNPLHLSKQVCRCTKDLATQFYFKENASEITYLEISPQTSVHMSAGKTIALGDEAVPLYFPETDRCSQETYLAVVPNGRAWGDLYTSVVWSQENHLLADISSGNVPFLFALEKLPPVHYFDETVAFISTLGGGTYYHWWVDILPRFELLRRSGIDWDSIDKFVINDYHKGFEKEVVQFLGLPEEKLITSMDYPHIQARQLIVPSVTSSTEKWLGAFLEGPSQWVCDFLRQKFRPLTHSSDSDPIEKIYISRKSAKIRRFVNEDEVSSLLESFGFKTIVLESLSVKEQLTLLAGAKMIVAPHGAGLTNTIFCQPGTKLIEIFSPRYVPDCYWIISNLVGLDYYYLLGESVEDYYLQNPHLYFKPVNCPPRAEHIYVNIESLFQTLKLAEMV